VSLYSLTHLTGRQRNADRKIIIATVETSKAGFVVSIVAVGASIIPTAIAVAIFGPPALVIVPPLFIAAGLWLFRSRSQKGLRLPMYKTLLDKGAAKRIKGQILICGVPIPTRATIGKLSYSSEARQATTKPNQHVEEARPAHGKAPKPSKTAPPTDDGPSAIWS
jgi:hypothetical protein